MNSWLIDLLQVSICFAVLYTLFYFLLRGLTFHRFNRVVLLLLIPLSLLLPFADAGVSLPGVAIEIPQFEGWLDLGQVADAEALPSEGLPANTPSPLSYLAIIYSIGLGLCLIRLLLIMIRIFQLKRQSKTVIDEGYTFVLAEVPTIFAFLKWIFVPQQKWRAYPQPIIEHEKVHVRKWHSLDLILAELYIAICWFNPLVYAYRKSIRAVHEFQADEAVLARQTRKSQYLALLLQHLEAEQPVRLHSYFNYPILKKRIDMITKNNSTSKNIWRYLLFIPVLSLLSMALNTKDYPIPPDMEQLTHTVPLHNPFSVFPVKNGSRKDITHFYGKSFLHPIKKKSVVHGGIDIRAKSGTPVLATSAGTVAKVAMENNWGNLIIITHVDGFETWYAHLKGFEIQQGQTVSEGQVIGYVGSTGLSTGPHLHYELRQYGERVDPMEYYKD